MSWEEALYGHVFGGADKDNWESGVAEDGWLHNNVKRLCKRKKPNSRSL